VARHLVDTNILIDHLRGEPLAGRFLQDVESGRTRATISVITECELLSVSTLTRREERRILALLALLPSVAVTPHIAQQAARLRRQHTITIADALIAATALSGHAILVTRNVKDFRSIRSLQIQSL